MLKTAKVKKVIPFVVFWSNLVHFWIKCIYHKAICFCEYDVGVKCREKQEETHQIGRLPESCRFTLTRCLYISVTFKAFSRQQLSEHIWVRIDLLSSRIEGHILMCVYVCVCVLSDETAWWLRGILITACKRLEMADVAQRWMDDEYGNQKLKIHPFSYSSPGSLRKVGVI